MLFWWKNDLKIEAVCGENIVNTVVFVSFHFFIEFKIFSALGWLGGVILRRFGDLCGPFCDFLEVRKSIEMLKRFRKRPVKKQTMRQDLDGGCVTLKEKPNRPPTAARRPEAQKIPRSSEDNPDSIQKART